MKQISWITFAMTLAATAQAGTLISNVATAIGGNANIFSTTATGNSFKMNVGTNYTLDAVQATLNNAGTSFAASELNIGLFADSSGLPSGSALVTLSISGNIVNGAATYTATPGSSFILLGNTSYWLILNDPNSARTLFWEIAANNVIATGTAATDAGDAQGSMTTATQAGSFLKSSFGPLMYEIDGTAVVASPTPEPSSLALAGLGLAVAVLRRRLA